ncbi:hypothetical protein CB0940_00046 [Cercospora beticola]|uniref:Uncharacterized protein n=1 Tax=Cercospora beticola TaxID=122368 RepID=A0A2G5IAW7_CERBT|nr:hypothetical protein CB0940_00046 [Cercospora beticola]PIB01935.1 hypothetical protein CB0940_00046 [Cercospora beticola]WPA95449.1 hypothetical protein RHO25_000048 [Cercospora beticola]
MAFHYGAGAMSRAAINIANPSQRWIEPNPEEVSKGKQVIKKAAAGIKKGGRELARAPSRLSNLRRLSYASSRGGGGESRPVSRLSAWMDKYIIGEEKEGEDSTEGPGVSDTNIEEEEASEGGNEAGVGQASEEKEEEVKKTPSRTASMIKRAFSFRKSRAFRASTAPSTLQPPQEEPQSDEKRGGTTTATPPSGEGSPLVRVAANEEIPDRTTSREAPVLPLPSFPSLITMPSGGEMEGSGAGPVGGEKVVVEEEEEEEEVVAVASLAFVGRARLVDLSAEE